MMNKGYTLIELMVVIGIMTLIIGSGMTIFYQSLKSGSKIDFESFMDSSSRVIEGSMADLVGYSKVVSVGSYGQSDCLDAGSGGVTGVSLTINVDDVLTRYSLSGDSIASVSGGLTQLVNQEGLGVSGLSFNWICLGGEREKVLVNYTASAEKDGQPVAITNDYSFEITVKNSGYY